MKLTTIPRRIALLVSLISAVACNWVPLTSEGEEVRVLSASAAADCRRVGEVTSKTSDRILIFARTERKVREELESLARNEAVELGGNAVVPIGSATDGRQSFEVYRCEFD